MSFQVTRYFNPRQRLGYLPETISKDEQEGFTGEHTSAAQPSCGASLMRLSGLPDCPHHLILERHQMTIEHYDIASLPFKNAWA